MVQSETPAKTPLQVPSHGNGMLKIGNPGNSGGGSPKLRVRKGAAAGTESAQKILLKFLEDHESGKIKLTATEAKNIYEALAKIGVGELKEQLTIASDMYLEATNDLLAFDVELGLITADYAVSFHKRLSERLQDV